MTCIQMGGSCSVIMSGETADELLSCGYTHVLQNHPEIVQRVMRMSEAERTAWTLDFQARWDQAPTLGE